MAEFAALGLGAIAQGAGSYFGGQAQANAQRQAAAQAEARWQQAYANSQPYMQSGTNALNMYNTGMGLNGADAQSQWANGMSSNPAFQASNKYGLDQLQARLAAQGMGMSGNESAGLSDYSQHNLLDFQNRTLENLFREGNLGSNVASSAMNSSTGASNTINNALTGAGTSTGSSYGAMGNAAGNLGSSYTNYYYGERKA